MRKVYVSTVLDQSVEDVWAVLGDFHRIERWVGMVHTCESENGDPSPTIGSVRRMTMGDEHRTGRERLVTYDPIARQISYDFPGGPPFGMSHYLPGMRVLPITDSGKTFIEWYGQYACDDVADVPRIETSLRGLYTMLLNDLRRYLDGDSAAAASPGAAKSTVDRGGSLDDDGYGPTLGVKGSPTAS
jgi:hypothetical protein